MATAIEPTIETVRTPLTDSEKLKLVIRLLAASALTNGYSVPRPNPQAAAGATAILLIVTNDEALEAFRTGDVNKASEVVQKQVDSGALPPTPAALLRQYVTDADLDALHPIARLMIEQQS